MNRRNFFKKLLTGAVAILTPTFLLQQEKKPALLINNKECRHMPGGIKKLYLVKGHTWKEQDTWITEFKKYSINQTKKGESFLLMDRPIVPFECKHYEIKS